MHSVTSRAVRTGRHLTLALLGAAALGACSDVEPFAAGERAQPLPSSTLQLMECVASVTDGMRCTPASPSTGEALGYIYGGQNTFVRLSSSNAGYNEGTGIFSVDVTVQNLLNEAIGTMDGSTPAVDGIRVFFVSEPVPTNGGTGDVEVFNADGSAFITSANQPYHTYTGVLATNQTSNAKTWEFTMPNTVSTFRFFVAVQTEVQYKLVINEVGVNPGGTILDANGEWFEIYNAGTFAVELQNLVIADSAASGRRPYHLISSSVVVPAGGYVVLGNTTNTTNNGGVTVDYAYGAALQLANSLDALKIARVAGTDTLTLDRTQYSSPGVSAQNGISRELKNPALDNSNMDGSNWADALVTAVYGPGGRGTPKAQNSTFEP